MPKYRLLTGEELNQLDQIFVNFLAANSITAGDWISIKKNDLEKMNSLIEEFSDVVFEKTLSNVKFLENRLEKKILMYEIQENDILLEGIEIEGDSSFDFRKEFDVSELNDLFKDEKINISFIEGKKPFFEDKNIEIFEMMESGAMISQNELLYTLIIKLKNEYSEK